MCVREMFVLETHGKANWNGFGLRARARGRRGWVDSNVRRSEDRDSP